MREATDVAQSLSAFVRRCHCLQQRNHMWAPTRPGREPNASQTQSWFEMGPLSPCAWEACHLEQWWVRFTLPSLYGTLRQTHKKTTRACLCSTLPCLPSAFGEKQNNQKAKICKMLNLKPFSPFSCAEPSHTWRVKVRRYLTVFFDKFVTQLENWRFNPLWDFFHCYQVIHELF